MAWYNQRERTPEITDRPPSFSADVDNDIERVECESCGGIVADIESHQAWASTKELFEYSLACPKCARDDGEIVAIRWKGELVKPGYFLSKTFLQSAEYNTVSGFDSTEIIDANSSEETMLSTYVLSKAAKETSSSGVFLYDPERMKGLLLAHEGRPVSYLQWNMHKGHPAIRGIFTLPDHQRSGHGSNLLNHWVENTVVDEERPYLIESPSPAMTALLLSNRYAYEEGGERFLKDGWRII